MKPKVKAVSESTFKSQLIKTYLPAAGALCYRKSGAWDIGAPEILAYRNPVFMALEAKTAHNYVMLWQKTRISQRNQLKRAHSKGAVACVAAKLRNGHVIARVMWPQNAWDAPGHYEFQDVTAFVTAVMG